MNFTATLASKVNKDGLYSVVVEVRFTGNIRRYINTGIKVKKSEWLRASRRVKGNDKANTIIKRLTEKLENWRMELLADGKAPHAELFDLWIDSGVIGGTFNYFYATTLRNDKTLSYVSKRDQMQTLHLLNEFRPSIKFNDLNKSLVIAWNNFLAGRDYNTNTIRKHHKNVKKYVNRAIDEGLIQVTIDKHPYRALRFPAKESDRINLSMEQLRAIEALQLSGMVAKVREVFLFCAATGSRFIDSQQAEYLIENGEISWVPVKTQKHTGRVRLPMDLICRDWVRLPVPVVSNAFGNRILKTIAIDAGIDKPISFHTARHTFLTLVAKKTGNLFKVMKYAGLRKPDTAMVYIHLAGV